MLYSKRNSVLSLTLFTVVWTIPSHMLFGSEGADQHTHGHSHSGNVTCSGSNCAKAKAKAKDGNWDLDDIGQEAYDLRSRVIQSNPNLTPEDKANLTREAWNKYTAETTTRKNRHWLAKIAQSGADTASETASGIFSGTGKMLRDAFFGNIDSKGRRTSANLFQDLIETMLKPFKETLAIKMANMAPPKVWLESERVLADPKMTMENLHFNPDVQERANAYLYDLDTSIEQGTGKPSVLLYGKSGTGKTAFIKALKDRYKENIEIILVNTQELLESNQNVGFDDWMVTKKRNAFEHLLSYADAPYKNYAGYPITKKVTCIFLDEGEFLFEPKRGSPSQKTQARRTEATKAFLQKLGSPNKHYFVAISTNYAGQIDAAVLNRLQHQIYVEEPNDQIRMETIVDYMQRRIRENMKFADIKFVPNLTDIEDPANAEIIAKSQGLTGRDLQMVANSAVTRVETIRNRKDFSGKPIAKPISDREDESDTDINLVTRPILLAKIQQQLDNLENRKKLSAEQDKKDLEAFKEELQRAAFQEYYRKQAESEVKKAAANIGKTDGKKTPAEIALEAMKNTLQGKKKPVGPEEECPDCHEHDEEENNYDRGNPQAFSYSDLERALLEAQGAQAQTAY